MYNVAISYGVYVWRTARNGGVDAIGAALATSAHRGVSNGLSGAETSHQQHIAYNVP